MAKKTIFEDCDILVVGGGMAGTGATFEARHWGRDLKIICVEKASKDIDQETLKKTEENLKKGKFSMQDYLEQLKQMKKMGGIEGVMSFLPGVSKIKSQMNKAGVDEKIITQNEAIILSMTKKERDDPKIINGSRRKRIANGSGTDVATINKLLKQFRLMSDMMKKMSKGDLKGMSDKGIPPELFNQLK